MEYLKKFSEAVEVAKSNKGDLEKIISQVMSECQNIENQFKTITDLYTGLSRRQIEINSEDKRLEIRFIELDSKERILEGREQDIDLKAKQLLAREHGADEKEKLLSTRQSEIDSEAKRLMIMFSELNTREKQLDTREHEADAKENNLIRRKSEIDLESRMLTVKFSELDLKERNVEGRVKEIDSREKLLDAREHEADGKEICLSRKLSEIDSEAKKLMIGFMSELDSKEIFLEGREMEIDLREKQLDTREHKLNGKEEMFSRRQSELDSEAKELMIRFSELDSKERNLEGRGKEIDSKEKQLDAKEHEVDGKEKIISTKQREIDSEEKKLMMRFSELDSKENLLEGRDKEIDSREKRLDARKHEVDGKENILNRRESEIDSEAVKLMTRLSELDLKEKFLKEREIDFGAKEKILAGRKLELDLKEITLGTRSNDVESRVRCLEMRETSMHFELKKMERRKLELLNKAEELVHLVKEPGLKEQLSDLNLTLCDPENSPGQFIEEPVSRNSAKSAEVVRSRKKRCLDLGTSDASQQMSMEISSSQMSNGLLHPHNHHNSDSMSNLASKSTAHPSSFDIGTEKGEVGRNVNIGEVWACFDPKYELPRSYAQVIRIFNKDGNDCLEVAWLKPRPVFNGENEWINSGLPVTCGNFYFSAINIASPRILCHPVSCVGESPWIIYPCEGETWALYKDWDISAWSSYPNVHRICEYEIVQILSHPRVESTCGIRVAPLVKITGYQNLFQRRGNNGEDSFLIDRTCLYRFSHRVRSVQKECIDANGTLRRVFELDQKCLPEELR